MSFSEYGDRGVNPSDIAQHLYDAGRKEALDQSIEQRFPELNENAARLFDEAQRAHDQITVSLNDEKFRYGYAFGNIMMLIGLPLHGTRAEVSKDVGNAVHHLDNYLNQMSENIIFSGEQGQAVRASLERYLGTLTSLRDACSE